VALVLGVERRFGRKLPKGRLFAVYVAGYTFGRFWIERIRTDRASKILGLRINEWTASILFVAALVVLFVSVTGKSRPVTDGAVDGGEGSHPGLQ
jgi:prolipoprotein diacylglyceryltransferase